MRRTRPGKDLDALRHLLGPEHVEHTPGELAQVLPEALAHSAEHRELDTSTALSKPLGHALRDVVRRDPEMFGEILAPTIGTAVRRAVKEAMSAIVERINALMERAFSLHSLRWRYEAKKSGRPLAEIVLSHTLLYRVEWVVLLHSQSSLVLGQANLPEVSARVPDQVAAMLHALSLFVSDALKETTPGGKLETLEVGDLSIWLERDPSLTLAAAIRGNAPAEFREQLRTTLERVRMLHVEDIGKPVLDTKPFEDTQPLLADCLQQKFRRPPNRAPFILAIAALVLLIFGGIALARAITERGARNDLVDLDARMATEYSRALEGEPGYVVTSVDRVGGLYRVEGLRDPRAQHPLELVAHAGLPPPVFALVAYESADARLGGLRELTLSAHALSLSSIEALEDITIAFPSGAAAVDSNTPEIRRAARLINIAHDAARHAGTSLCIEVRGETDPAGGPGFNALLRAARAQNIARALEDAGVRRNVLEPIAASPLRQPPRERRVTFHAALRPGPTEGGCRSP